MATFNNPIRTRTGGSVPTGAFEEADLSGVVGGALDFGAETVARVNREELEEQVTGEAESFIDRPEDMTELQRLSREAESERSRPFQQQDRKVLDRLNRDTRRLRRALEQGAASSTEVKMRADQLTRDAIAENPSLAGDLIRERNQTLGLFGTELQAADQRMENLTAAEEPNELSQQFFKQAQEDLTNMGIGVPTGDRARILELWRDNVAGPQFFESQLDQLQNQNELSKQQAERMAPEVVKAASGRVHSRMQNILNNSELTADEQVQALADLRLNERNKLDGRLNVLGTEETNRRFSRIDEVIEKNIQALQGNYSVEKAQNSLNALVTSTAESVAREEEALLAGAVVRELGGDALTSRLAELNLGGIDQSISGLTEIVKNVANGIQQDLGASDITTLDQRLGAFDTWFESVRDEINDGAVSRDEGKQLIRNVVRAALPSSDKDMSEISLDKWNRALEALSKPSFREAIETSELTGEEMTNLRANLIRYNTEILEPNMTQALVERIELGEGLGMREAATTPSVPVVSLIEPQFNETNDPNRRGNITFVFSEERANETLGAGRSLGPRGRRRIQEKINQLNRTYAKRWNQSVHLNANMRDSADPLRISTQRWNDRFAAPAETEEGEGNDE